MIEVTYVDHMGTDLSVVNAARVSFGKKSELECIDLVKGKYAMKHADVKLIKYLAKHKHKSPFNHAFATFHVKAPVFVARQLVKHEYMPWNEISRRYVDEEPEFYVPPVWRGRSADKKQGSEGTVDDINPLFVSDMKVNALEDYNYLLSQGVCPEQARMILPQNMMTEWFWSGSLFAFAKMCSLRCKDDTQAETRVVADAIDEEVERLYPVSWEALREYTE